MGSLRPSPRAAATAGALALLAVALGASGAGATSRAHVASDATTTPIKHVIVIVGENHTFDNVFATYKPRHGQTVMDLLSEGIVKANGNPGAERRPRAPVDRERHVTADGYSTDPKLVAPYKTLPAAEHDLRRPAMRRRSGHERRDSRFPANLPNAPFQITKYVPYDEVHAGFQVVRQRRLRGRPPAPLLPDEPADRAEPEQAVGVDGRHTPATPTARPRAGTTDQGAVSMGFYNVQHGDAPVLDYLANHFSMSDNYHQAVMGGTGTNHVALGTGSAASYENAAGDPPTPPANQIENPNAQPGTNNWYTQDGYSGGTYSKCADHVAAGRGRCHRLPSKCWPYARPRTAPRTRTTC